MTHLPPSLPCVKLLQLNRRTTIHHHPTRTHLPLPAWTVKSANSKPVTSDPHGGALTFNHFLTLMPCAWLGFDFMAKSSMTMENLNWDSADGLELIDFNGFNLLSFFHGNTQREQSWATEGRCLPLQWIQTQINNWRASTHCEAFPVSLAQQMTRLVQVIPDSSFSSAIQSALAAHIVHGNQVDRPTHEPKPKIKPMGLKDMSHVRQHIKYNYVTKTVWLRC